MFSLSWNFGSLTNKIRGIENNAHQTPTEINEYFVASTASNNPKELGYEIIKKLIIINTPPPRYPSENPKADTWSTFSSFETEGSNES